LIGWWSVVMLSAGFATLLLEHAPYAVRAIWIEGGMLGLLSAVGLESAQRTRARKDLPQKNAPPQSR
jgi:hypothetical protein